MKDEEAFMIVAAGLNALQDQQVPHRALLAVSVMMLIKRC
jgi:hypothetical protein